MKRYLPLLLVAFLFIVVLLCSSVYLSSYAGKADSGNINSISVYTDLPVEQIEFLASAFEEDQKVKINIIPLSSQNLVDRLKTEKTGGSGDVVIADSNVLNQLKKEQLLMPYVSEITDIVPMRFQDQDNAWTGLWYDPVVFAANQDFLKTLPQQPVKWADLAKDNKWRLVITDFLAAEASANLFYSMIAVNGEQQTMDYFRQLHPSIVQYAKYLATPVRMAALGEADIAIAVHSEAMRYIHNKFPIQIIYPEEGTAYLLTGAAVLNTAAHSQEAKQFVDWLLQDHAQLVLKQTGYFFVTTNPEAAAYRDDGAKNIKLFENKTAFLPAQQRQMLDRWVQSVRLNAAKNTGK
ncbi:MAG: extracellular solute-binding protein [Pelosinus sp.]|nr:extracellular solute-binding protein [Pelosinus sp.]